MDHTSQQKYDILSFMEFPSATSNVLGFVKLVSAVIRTRNISIFIKVQAHTLAAEVMN